MYNLTRNLADNLLLENAIDFLITEIVRNHGSQYKGKKERRFSNILKATKEKTNIYFSTHFEDQIRDRIAGNADLKYDEYQEFKDLLPSRITKSILEIHNRFSLNELIDHEQCFLCWFPKTKDAFIVALDNDFRHNDMNALVFTTILPRRTDDTLPTTRSPNDIFITINED